MVTALPFPCRMLSSIAIIHCCRLVRRSEEWPLLFDEFPGDTLPTRVNRHPLIHVSHSNIFIRRDAAWRGARWFQSDCFCTKFRISVNCQSIFFFFRSTFELVIVISKLKDPMVLTNYASHPHLPNLKTPRNIFCPILKKTQQM